MSDEFERTDAIEKAGLGGRHHASLERAADVLSTIKDSQTGYVDLMALNRKRAEDEGHRNLRFEHIDVGKQWREFGHFEVVFLFSLYHHIYECAGGDHRPIWFWLWRHCSSSAAGLGGAAGSYYAAGKDQRDLAKFCDEKSPSVTDLPIDRIGQAVQPTPTQRAALDDLKDASVKAAEDLKVSCPPYQMLTPTGRVEAMEKRLDATLGAVKTVQPPLAKFYNSLSDEQKARFNSLRSASRPAG